MLYQLSYTPPAADAHSGNRGRMQGLALPEARFCGQNGAMSIRRRIEQWDWPPRLLSRLLAGWLRLCFATTRWERPGLDDLTEDLAQGPVLVVLWHQRLMIGPLAWPLEQADIHTLRDPSPAGRLSSETQTRLGLKPVMMREGGGNIAASRRVLKLLRAGQSLALTADGPRGPARQAKEAPVEWARVSGRPVYLFSWSARRFWKLGSWDGLMIPLPFTRGVYGYRRWPVEMPRRLDEAGRQEMQAALSRALDEWTAETDRRAGRI